MAATILAALASMVGSTGEAADAAPTPLIMISLMMSNALVSVVADTPLDEAAGRVVVCEVVLEADLPVHDV